MAEIDQRRWPEGGLTEAQLVEIRKLKARVEAERLPRGADPERHTKLGPGGLADVEWTVQTAAARSTPTGCRSCVPRARSSRCAPPGTPV